MLPILYFLNQNILTFNIEVEVYVKGKYLPIRILGWELTVMPLQGTLILTILPWNNAQPVWIVNPTTEGRSAGVELVLIVLH